MVVAIRYFTKSKKGNTIKLANYVSNKLNVVAKDVSQNLNGEVDVLFLVNAMYAATIDKRVKKFLVNNSKHIKCLVNISSSASGSSTYKAVKKVCDKCKIKMSEKEYHTVASWIFLNKDRPNEKDFARLGRFVAEVVNG